MKYTKEIKVDSSGIVSAIVKDGNGECKGEKRFTTFFACATDWNWVLVRDSKQAHAWADERIKVCESQEVTTQNEEHYPEYKDMLCQECGGLPNEAGECPKCL